MRRNAMISRLAEKEEWDICIIGGGATGLGAAVDAASRGLSTVLLERFDFAKGTSSRSTKLVHGGVRYLQQGNIKLVLEALHERGLMLKNAPHLVKNQSFVIPNYAWWESAVYGIGLKAYDWMSGNLGLGPSQFLSVEETLQAAPTLDKTDLRGGILYHDGQFDDARMAVHLAMTAADCGAVVLNYFPVQKFIKTNGKITGVLATDSIDGLSYAIKARAIINATGAFTDEVTMMDNPQRPELLTLSQGVHIVLDKEFLPSDTAIMIPRTEDGRVLFAVPWHQKIIVGTTDTAVMSPSMEPVALPSEIAFILQHIRNYLTKEPYPEDIRSVFCGLRPLIRAEGKSTAAISREHHISVSDAELITITGGKWTTYRKMAEDVIDVAIQKAQLSGQKSETADLHLHGYHPGTDFDEPLYYYGSDKSRIVEIMDGDPSLREKIHSDYPYVKAEIVWAVHEEMCQLPEDFLARRCRLLFLDASAAIQSVPVVANVMAGLMEKDENWVSTQIQSFTSLAKNYLPFQNQQA